MRCLILPTFVVSVAFAASPPSPSAPVGGMSCGGSGPFNVAAVNQIYPLVSSLATVFQADYCPLNPVNVTSAGSDQEAVTNLCSKNVDIAFVTRPLDTSEATKNDGASYHCTNSNTNATLIQIAVAADAIVLTAASGGYAAQCMASLPGGGLTLKQVRWIYSNYTLKQLKATGFSPSSLPNSDDLDSTHYWSELCPLRHNCSKYCPPREISLIGPMKDSDMLSFVRTKVLSDAAHGESVDIFRYNNASESSGVNGLKANPYALGLINFANYTSNGTYAASLQGTTSNYFAPCKGTLQNMLYPLVRTVYMTIRVDQFEVFPKVRPFAKLLFSSIGDSFLSGNGFVPLSNLNKLTSFNLLVENRRRLSRQLSSQNFGCGLLGHITAEGEPVLKDLADSWAQVYSVACPNRTFTVVNPPSTNAVAISKLCGGQVVDVALMTRLLKPSEAIPQSTYTYLCSNNRKITRIKVAIKGAEVSCKMAKGGAYDCINSLGGLTLDQLRWIFSSFTTSQLIATGWDPSSVPKTDNNDGTHLWSELGGAKCPPTEIRIAGPPDTSSTFALLKNIVLRGNGETIAVDRPFGYFSGMDPVCPNGYPQGNPDAVAQYVNTYPNAIGLFDFTSNTSGLFESQNKFRELTQTSLVAVPLKNAQGQAVYANANTLSACTYPLCNHLYMYIKGLNASPSFQKTCKWLRFGFTGLGQAIVSNIALLTPLDASEANTQKGRLMC